MKPNSLLGKVLSSALIALTLAGAASAASYGTGVVNASALHMRAKATTSSTSLAVAKAGARVDVLSDAVNGWYQVSYNGKTGYMSARYLDVTPYQTAESGALGNGKVTLSSGTLNLRSGPSTSHSRVGAIPKGTVLPLLAEENGWYQVEYRGTVGYVSAKYITPTGESVTSYDNATGAKIVALADSFLGTPYVWGGNGPNSFDCSGFTSYIYAQFGYTIYRTAATQLLNNGTPVSYSDLQPGDLVFFKDFGSNKAATHVGIYTGNGQFIHAAQGRGCVIYTNLSSSWYAARYVGARRIL